MKADIPEYEFDDEFFDDEPQTWRDRLWVYVRGLVTVIVLLGLLFISGIYQGTLFHKTPERVQEKLPAAVEAEELIVPISIFVVQTDDTNGSERNEKNVLQLVSNANAIWHQAAISLVVEDITFLDIADEAAAEFLEYPDAIFAEHAVPKENIRVVLLGTLRGLNGIAFTGLRTVSVADHTTVHDYRTLAHEVGHILGLSHTGNSSDLMFSGSNGMDLSRDEIEIARSRADVL